MKTKRIFSLIMVVAFFLFYGLLLSQFQISITKDQIRPNFNNGYYDYKGVTSVLTDSHDPSYAEIISAAKESDLNFLITTRINDFSSEDAIHEKYDGDLLLLQGNEYTFVDSRLLNLQKQYKKQYSTLGQAQVGIADLINQDSGSSDSNETMVLTNLFEQSQFGSDKFLPGLDGLEVINLKNMWQQKWSNEKISSIWSILIYPFNPRLAILRLFENPDKEMDVWDQLTLNRSVVGVLGNESRNRPLYLGPLGEIQFPSFKTFFQLANTHLLLTSELTGNAQSDREKVMTSLANGQFYIALDLLANPRGFWAEMKSGQQKFPMGSTIKNKESLKLIVNLPQEPQTPYETMVLKDGQLYMTSNSPITSIDIHTPGTYRVVVRVIPTLPLPDGKKWIPWIYANPFYVR